MIPSLGERLRELRERQGWSLREVAGRAGVNHGYLSQLERGEVSQPAPSMLHKLSEGYGEPFVVLMRWAGYVDTVDTELTSTQARALSYLGDDISEEELGAIKAVLDVLRTKRATFASLAGSLDGNLPVEDRRAIRQHAESLLRKADALGVTPTPLEQLLEVAQLVAAGEVTLDEEERRQLRRMFGSLVDRVFEGLRGAIHFRAREVWVRPDLHEMKKRFVTAHEIGHDLLPWQRDVLAYLDDDERIRPDVRITYERQANQAAIELLAQGDRLRKEADDSRLGLGAFWDLSAKYQISMVAVARRIAEETRHEAAVSIQFRGRSGYLGPAHTYCSDSFARRFGWHLTPFPPEARTASSAAISDGHPQHCLTVDRSSSIVDMTIDAVDTGYAIVSLATPTPKVSATRRLLQVS